MYKTCPDLRSWEQVLAEEFSAAEQETILSEFDLDILQFAWEYTARPDQFNATIDTAHIVGIVAGRGAGKTRNGAEWIRHRVGRNRRRRFALVGRTAADVRDTMVEGESGLMNIFPPSEQPVYTPARRRVTFKDGSVALCFSAEEPNQIRGPQFDYGWGDELAAWDLRPDDSGLTAWDNLLFATRLGEEPQVLFTTTPKRVKLMRQLLADARTNAHISIYNQASTFDNKHLSKVYTGMIEGIYGGTKLASQELMGILTDEVEGALWHEQQLEESRTYEDPGKLPIRIIGVDPSVSDEPEDECGIIAVGATPISGPFYKRVGYILGDYSLYGPPAVWAREVARVAVLHDATVVAEQNQGGAMVREMIHTANPKVAVRLVTAKVSKKLRAEPLALASQQGRLKIFRRYPMLEDQMTTWDPAETQDSPDRLDALVHALAGTITAPVRKTGTAGGSAVLSNPARGRRLEIASGR